MCLRAKREHPQECPWVFHHPWEMRAGLCGVTKAGVTSSATPCRDQGLLASHPSHPHLLFPSLPPLPWHSRLPSRAGLCAGSQTPEGLPDSSLGVFQPVFLQTDPHGIFWPCPGRSSPAFRAMDRHTARSRTDSQLLLRGQAGIQPPTLVASPWNSEQCQEGSVPSLFLGIRRGWGEEGRVPGLSSPPGK